MTPARTCTEVQITNVDSLEKKTIKQSVKPLEKITHSPEYIYKPKMQTNKQMHQQAIAQYGYAHTTQNAEMKRAKMLCHLFPHNTIKKTRNKTKKKPKQISKYSKVYPQTNTLNICAKAQNSRM